MFCVFCLVSCVCVCVYVTVENVCYVWWLQATVQCFCVILVFDVWEEKFYSPFLWFRILAINDRNDVSLICYSLQVQVFIWSKLKRTETEIYDFHLNKYNDWCVKIEFVHELISWFTCGECFPCHHVQIEMLLCWNPSASSILLHEHAIVVLWKCVRSCLPSLGRELVQWILGAFE